MTIYKYWFWDASRTYSKEAIEVKETPKRYTDIHGNFYPKDEIGKVCRYYGNTIVMEMDDDAEAIKIYRNHLKDRAERLLNEANHLLELIKDEERTTE